MQAPNGIVEMLFDNVRFISLINERTFDLLSSVRIHSLLLTFVIVSNMFKGDLSLKAERKRIESFFIERSLIFDPVY